MKNVLTFASLFMLFGFMVLFTYGVDHTEFLDETSTAYEVAKELRTDMTGKTVIVTGANTGIGKETAKILMMRGAKVIMACRDKNKCYIAKSDIIVELNMEKRLMAPKVNLRQNLIVRELDLSSLQSVLDFVKRFVTEKHDLHVLINNAGVMRIQDYTLSQDGYEMQFATNHLGHFYLTRLLLNKLKVNSNGNGALVINVASRAHHYAPEPIISVIESGLKRSDGPSESAYDANKNYGISKMFNILFARELDRLYGDTEHVYSVSLHPGVIKTELQRHMDASKINDKMFDKSIGQGAATQVMLALMDVKDIVRGGYYDDCQPHLDRLRDDVKAFDGGNYEDSPEYKLWELSNKLIEQKGFSFDFVVPVLSHMDL